jgi:predicted ATPase
MERAAALAHNDTTQMKLDKLDALLAQSFTSCVDTALFAEILSLQNDGRYPTLDLTAQQRRSKTLEALTAQVETLSRTKPALMIFEDVHWSDPTSLEALGRTLDRLRSLQALLIVTYRPEFEPPWIGRPYVTALTLNRLGEREIAALIERVACKKSLPESVRQDIIERTDGIPLFVEEMTRAVVEAETDADAQRTARRCSLFGRSSSRKPPRLTHGTARPARSRQRSGANRIGYWAGVLVRPPGSCRGQAKTRFPIGS